MLLQAVILVGQDTVLQTTENDTIKFKLTEHNNISIESILNETDTINLMFHTAVSSVSLTPEQSQNLSPKINKKTSDVNSWGGNQDVDYVENNKLAIGNRQWDDITLWLNLLSGHDTDGKFGPNLFSNNIIEINFDRLIIVLHENELKELDNYKTFDISTDDNNSLFIEGELLINEVRLKHKFMIHSGYGGTIILDDQFCSANPIIGELEVFEEKDLKDSLGNLIKTKKARANQFNILNVEFDSVPFSYFDSELTIQKTSVLGGAFLKRFNLLLDLENMKLHVKPNKLTESKFKS